MQRFNYLYCTILFLVMFVQLSAQQKTIVGTRFSVLWFTPESVDGRYNTYMGNGPGFSAGIFFEDQLKPKIISVAEIGFARLGTEVSVIRYSVGGYDGFTQSGFRGKVNFDYLTLSAGAKYFLSERLYAYPSFEVSHSVDGNIKIKKTTYNAGMRLGYAFNFLDITLGYVYGLKNQGSVYFKDDGAILGLNHRNRFWQGSISIPIKKF